MWLWYSASSEGLRPVSFTYTHQPRNAVFVAGLAVTRAAFLTLYEHLVANIIHEPFTASLFVYKDEMFIGVYTPIAGQWAWFFARPVASIVAGTGAAILPRLFVAFWG